MAYPHKLDEARILDEAAKIVDECGLVGLSTRTLAERLDARAPSLYRYFPDKEALIGGISERLLEQLVDELRPHDTLLGIARAYWSYARRYPRRYDVIFHHAPEIEPFLAIASTLTPDRPLATAHAIWAYVHGAVQLCPAKPGGIGFDPVEAFESGLRALEFGLTHAVHSEPKR
ncbi:MAG: TetR/AcrR family transcriptional regulator [Thermomicrobiales bacterium]|nr:TetR/AcrR family transcriptional regulator [Thermomicrobiales bacterium]